MTGARQKCQLRLTSLLIHNAVVIGAPCPNPRKSATVEDNCYMRKSTSHVLNAQSRKFRCATVFALVLALTTLAFPPLAQATYTIFGPFPMIITQYGVGTLTIVPPTSNSPGPWSYTSSNPTVATVNGGVLNILTTGAATITATQAASAGYTERSRSTQVRVTQGNPVLGDFADQTVSIWQNTYTLVPPTSTSNATWSFTSSDPKIVSIAGSTATLLDGGKVVITARQDPTSQWLATSKLMTLTINALDSKLGTFGSITIMKDSVGSLNLMAPTSLSIGAWTFTSSNSNVATISGSTLTPRGYGTSVITAAQARSGNYGSSKTSMTLTVLAASPTIGIFTDRSVTFSPTSSKVLTLLPPTSNSTGEWTLVSSDPSVATSSGLTLTLLKAGSTTITATQLAAGSYGPSTPVLMVLTVVGAPTIGVWSDIEKVVRDPDFTLTPPTSTSPGAWTFSSDHPEVIEIVGDVAKVKGAGKATITATQAASSFWQAGEVKMTVLVYGDIPTLGIFASIEGGVGDDPILITAPTSNSKGTWTYSSSNKKVAIVKDGAIVIVGVGVSTLSATQSPAGIYSQSNTVQTTITSKESPVVGNFANLKIIYGSPIPNILPPTSTSTTPWSYESSDTSVVQIVGSAIQVVGIGITKITARQASTATLAGVKRTFNIQVIVPSGPTPKPTKKPSAKPSVKPTPNVTSRSRAKPIVKVTVLKRVLTISVTGAKATATINGSKAKVGKNTLKPGLYIVIVSIAKKIVFSKTYRIK